MLPSASVLETFFDRDRLRIVLDPIVEHAGNQVVHGYEALMRGPRDMPFESPTLAFALAKSMDILSELDLRCVQAALEAGSEVPQLFVNLHPSTLDRRGCHQLLQMVEEKGRDPRSVTVEVTEHQGGGESDLRRSVAFLKARGFRIAVDDFGEGSSNLGRVMRLRPDYLKLDRSLVMDAATSPECRAVLRAMGGLGTELGCSVIAEGVENDAVLEIVAESGIPLSQGWHYETVTPQSAAGEPVGSVLAVGSLTQEELMSAIDSMSEEQLDQLPVGVIQLTNDGTILQYNCYEEQLSSVDARSVVGRNFFTEVAPCTDVRDFAGRFRKGVAEGSLHSSFDFVFAFDPPREVRVTLFMSAKTNTIWVFVKG